MVQRTKPLATDQGRDISIAVKGAQTVPGRSPSIHTPLAPSIQPRSDLRQQSTPAAPTTTGKGVNHTHRLRTLVEGAESRRADPSNSAWQWGAAGANPSGWWMGVLEGFRMGLPALNEAR